jgi:hypothetical protein
MKPGELGVHLEASLALEKALGLSLRGPRAAELVSGTRVESNGAGISFDSRDAAF